MTFKPGALERTKRRSLPLDAERAQKVFGYVRNRGVSDADWWLEAHSALRNQVAHWQEFDETRPAVWILDPSGLLSSASSGLENWVLRRLLLSRRSHYLDASLRAWQRILGNELLPSTGSSLPAWMPHDFVAPRLGSGEEAFLRSRFQSPDWPTVLQFVANNAQLVPLLRRLPEEVSRIFGDTTILLEVYREPEASHRQLAASIRTTLAPEEATGLLRALDAAWWLDALPRAEGRLLVTTEFV